MTKRGKPSPAEFIAGTDCNFATGQIYLRKNGEETDGYSKGQKDRHRVYFNGYGMQRAQAVVCHKLGIWTYIGGPEAHHCDGDHSNDSADNLAVPLTPKAHDILEQQRIDAECWRALKAHERQAVSA